jgi:hypothetical protein
VEAEAEAEAARGRFSDKSRVGGGAGGGGREARTRAREACTDINLERGSPAFPVRAVASSRPRRRPTADVRLPRA